jgi:hypothetical protein
MARVMNVLLPCLLVVLVIGLLMTKREASRSPPICTSKVPANSTSLVED